MDGIKIIYFKCKDEYGIYVKGLNQDNLNTMCLYVNDLLITISIHNGIENPKFKTKTEFDFTKLRGLS